jgi:hypothetical protein
MEEKLDKLIALMEMQNRAWEKCLELLFNVTETLTADKRERHALLAKHPPPPRTPSDIAQAANSYNDQNHYGADLEEHNYEQPAPQAKLPEPQQLTVTSKAEMMEQVEKKEISS